MTTQHKKVIFTVRKRRCGKVMFLHLSVSHSVHRGVSASVHAGIHTPPGQTPPWEDTPPGRHPLTQCMLGYKHPSAQCMLGYTSPLLSACWDRHGYWCRRYTSYWNAFLFKHEFPGLKLFMKFSCSAAFTSLLGAQTTQ